MKISQKVIVGRAAALAYARPVLSEHGRDADGFIASSFCEGPAGPVRV